jgi:RNA polymerase sigma-70 factor (ECF subfamily)
MAVTQLSSMFDLIHGGIRGDVPSESDPELLQAFVQRREGAALAALIRRHGPMVWGVCRRLLRDHHEAEDAFQATFVVLLRKASTIARRELVANWLHGVAQRTALRARTPGRKRPPGTAGGGYGRAGRRGSERGRRRPLDPR